MKKTQSKAKSKIVAALPARKDGSDLDGSITITRSTLPRKGSSVVFLIPGVRGTVKIARSAFKGEPPAVLEVVGSPFAPAAVPMAKLTKEERAAIRAKLTPQDKARIARERANRAMARAVELEAAV